MKNKLLSVCIPVYNRREVFKHCLIKACQACMESSEDVEVVISDNNSEDDLYFIVEEIRLEFLDIDIIYNKNKENIGSSRNFFKVIDMASGEFCWIVGSDDFVKKDSIKTLIDIIKQNNDISFICCNYDSIFLNKLKFENGEYIDIHQQLLNENMLVKHRAPVWTGIVEKFDSLVDPVFNNVFLGAVMTGIFKKSLWNNVNKSNIEWDGFSGLESIYPHCYIYAKAFLGKKAYYYGKPLITVGEGTREWSTDKGNSFWNSSLPLIFFNIWGDMIYNYKICGLDTIQYRKCRGAVAKTAGTYFLPVFFRKCVLGQHIQNSENIKIGKVLKAYLFVPSFYKGILKSIINFFKGILKALIKRAGIKSIR